MANIINLSAEQGANYIGDDAQPSITITNTSTGPALFVDRLVVASGASIAGGFTLAGGGALGGTAFLSTVSINAVTLTTSALSLNRVAGNTSVGTVQISASGASVPIVQLLGQSFTSAVSLIFAAGANWAGMGAIRVQLSDGITYGWIPVLPNGQVTAAAVQ